MNPQIAQMGRRVLDADSLGPAEALFLAGLEGDDLYDLFYWANRVRLKHFGRRVTFCSIAAAKVGACSEDCKFCAQSARFATHAATLSRLSDEQLVQAAAEASANGAESFGIVNSGRGPNDRELDALAGPVARIVADGGARPCASLGVLTFEQARRLVAIGVRRYNHNLETSRRHFPNIVTTHRYDDRLATLRVARDAGLSLCCGGIFNLGEDWADRIDLAMTLRQVDPDVVPLNFLNPIPGTPLADTPSMPPMTILQIVAIYRLLLPAKPIKLAGGRDVNLRDLQSWAFYCGASSVMIGNYLTTFGRPVEADHQMIRDLGLAATPAAPLDEGRAGPTSKAPISPSA